MRTVEMTIPGLPVNGNSTYVSNGRATVNFDSIPPIDELETCVRGIWINVDAGFVHDNVGAINLPEEIAFRAIDQIKLVSKDGHVWVDLDEQAGWLLYCYLHSAFGRRPNAHGGGGNVSLTNGVTTTVRVPLYIPFVLPGGEEPDDFNVSLRDLQQCSLELRWATADAGGVFDSGADNERLANTSAISVDVDLIGREEAYRGGMRWSLRALEVPGINETLPCLNERLLSLIEVPLHASGITVNRITDAERDTFRLIVDGKEPVQLVDARQLSRRWNRIHATARAEELTHHETNASPWLPLFSPGRRPIKVTHCPLAERKNPMIRFTGTDTTPKVVYLTVAERDDEQVIRQIRTSGAKLPPGFGDNPAQFVSAKTASKVGAGADVNASMPFVVKRDAA